MRSRPHRNRQAGFSLIELTVTMGIMVAILGVTAGLMADALRNAAVSNETTEAQQSLRAAHEYMNRDLLVAGDGLNGFRFIEARLPLSFVLNNITTDPNEVRALTVNGVTTTYVVPPIIAADDAQTRSGAATALLAGTDRLTVMTLLNEPNFPVTIIGTTAGVFARPNANTIVANVSAATASLFKAGEVVFLNADTGVRGAPATFAAITSVTTSGTTGQITFAAGDPYGLNTTNLPLLADVACGAGNFGGACQTVGVQRVLIITYFVDGDGLLRRRVLGRPRRGTTTEAEFTAAAVAGDVVAEHVTALDARYGLISLDRSGWEVVDRMTFDQEGRVRQVEVKITAETPHAILKETETSPARHAKTSSVVRTTVRTMEYRNAL